MEISKMKHCFAVWEVAAIALPAFGAGVLFTMFMPSCLLCGTCALVFVGSGAAILFAR